MKKLDKAMKVEGPSFVEKLFNCAELYHLLFENATDAILFAESSLIIDCNKAALVQFGITSKQELIGKLTSNFIDIPKSGEILQEEKNVQASALAVQKYQSKIVKPDQTATEAKITLNTFVYENHTIQELTVQEIISETEKVRTETENKYKKIFENVQDVFYRTNLSGIITEVSPSAKRYSKLFDTEIVGQSIENYYHNPADREHIIQGIKEKGEVFDFEVLLKGKNNQLVWASINAHFTYDDVHNITGIEGMIRDVTERKQAEDNMKQSLSLLQATLESTSDGILVVDSSGKVTSYNRRFKTIFGISEELLATGNDSVLLNAVLDIMQHPEQFIAKVRYLYDNPWLESDDIIHFKDGRVIERFSCPQLLDGKPIGRVWSFKDVTLRKQAEKALQESEERYRTFFTGSPDAIFLADVESGIIIDANLAAAELLKKPIQEIIGLHQTQLHPAQLKKVSRKKFQEGASRSGKNGPLTTNEILVINSENREIPVEILSNVIHINGRPVLQGVFRDITERKQAEELLRQSEIKYRNLIETMPDGVYRSTEEGKFVEVNPAMVKMLGYESKEELMAIDISSQLYFNPEDRESLILETNPEELDVFPLKKKDGTAVWIEDHGWYVRDQNNNILFHEGISRDVTDRKMAEMQLQKYSEELQELNATKDKFFSIIAHDLKSPFNSISGLSEIIRNEAKHLDIATIEQYAENIHATSNKTFRLLENLLDWARVQQSGMTFRPDFYNLEKLVNEVIDQLVQKSNSKMIALINYVPDDLIIHADKDMLTTVLRNLTFNALKFTPANGKVEIKAIFAGNAIEISVKDNGIGISQDDINKIFKIGSGFSKRGTENEKGTGLGLMLCKEFVEKHGGKIWVESEEGKGSTFTFSINQNDS